MVDQAGGRPLDTLRVEASDCEEETDKQNSVHIKKEQECCSINLNDPLNTCDSHTKIHVKEVPVEYETVIKEEVDVEPTVLQPFYSSGSLLHATKIYCGDAISGIAPIKDQNYFPVEPDNVIDQTYSFKETAATSYRRNPELVVYSVRAAKANSTGYSHKIVVEVDVHRRHCSETGTSVSTTNAVRPKSKELMREYIAWKKRETEASNYGFPIRWKLPKSGAQRMREYRARKKKEFEATNGGFPVQRKRPKSSAQRTRECRARKKNETQAACDVSLTHQDSPKTGATNSQDRRAQKENEIQAECDVSLIHQETLKTATTESQECIAQKENETRATHDVSPIHQRCLNTVATSLEEWRTRKENDVQVVSDVSPIRRRKCPKSTAERSREYRARKKKETEATNGGSPIQRKLPKSSAQRTRECRARKKNEVQAECDVSLTHQETLKTSTTASSQEGRVQRENETQASRDASPNHQERLNTAATSLEECRAEKENETPERGMGDFRSKPESETQHIGSSTPRTSAGFYERDDEEDCGVSYGDNYEIDENSKSDTLLMERVLKANDTFKDEESSILDDALCDDMHNSEEHLQILEHPSHNNKSLKLSTERTQKSRRNRKQSFRDRKRIKNGTSSRDYRRGVREEHGLRFEGDHSHSENATKEIQPSIETHQVFLPDEEVTEEKKDVSSQTVRGLDDGTDNLLDSSNKSHTKATEIRTVRKQNSRRAIAPLPDRDRPIPVLRLDSGKKRLVCGLCHASFRFMSQITKHLRSHTGEKPFRCEHCDARFRLSHHLAQHRRTHTGERPYRCDDCDMKFRQLAHLTIHKRTHTGEKPYRCKICGARFRQSGSLAYHEQKHTNRQEGYRRQIFDDKLEDGDESSLRDRCHNKEKPEHDVLRVKFKETRSIVGHKRAMKVFQVVGF